MAKQNNGGEDKLRQLYGVLSQDELYSSKVGTEDEFLAKMSNPDKAKQMWSVLSQDSLYMDKIGGEDEFMAKIGLGKPVPEGGAPAPSAGGSAGRIGGGATMRASQSELPSGSDSQSEGSIRLPKGLPKIRTTENVPGMERAMSEVRVQEERKEAIDVYDTQISKAEESESNLERFSEDVISEGDITLKDLRVLRQAESQFKIPNVNDYYSRKKGVMEEMNAELESWAKSRSDNFEKDVQAKFDSDPRVSKLRSKMQSEYDEAIVKLRSEGATEDEYRELEESVYAKYEPEFEFIFSEIQSSEQALFREELDKKVESLSSPKTNLLDESGVKPMIDAAFDRPDMDILDASSKKDLLDKSFIAAVKALRSKRGSLTFEDVKSLRDEFDAIYLERAFTRKSGAPSLFLIKTAAEQQLPSLREVYDGMLDAYNNGRGYENKNLPYGYVEQSEMPEAIERLRIAIESLEEVVRMPENSSGGSFRDFWSEFSSQGIYQYIPFVGSLNSLADNYEIYEASREGVDISGRSVNPVSEYLLEANSFLNTATSLNQENLNRAQRVGASLRESVPFIGEFALTAGVGNAGKQLVKNIAKKALKSQAETLVGKGLSYGLETLVSSLAQTTSNPQQYLNGVLERMTPEMEIAFSDMELVSVIDESSADDFGSAFLKAYGETFAEFFTERLGSAGAKFKNYAVNEAIKTELGKRMMIGYYMSVKGLTVPQFVSKFKNRIGWDGFFEEVGEEIVNIPLTNLLTGDRPVFEGLNFESVGDIVAATAIMTRSLAVPSYVATGIKALTPSTVTLSYLDDNGNPTTVTVNRDAWEKAQMAIKSPDGLGNFIANELPNLKLEGEGRMLITQMLDKAFADQKKKGKVSDGIVIMSEATEPVDGLSVDFNLYSSAEEEPTKIEQDETTGDEDLGADGALRDADEGEVRDTPTAEEDAARLEEIEREEVELGVNKQRVPVEDIIVAPDVFQFKAVDEADSGVNRAEKLEGDFDEDLAQSIGVWVDKENELGNGVGAVYVVDGHHRLDLAKRSGVEDMNVYYIQAPTAKDARRKAAMANIAMGRGTAIDAAKIFRDSDIEDFVPKSKVGRDGKELSKLSDGIFEMVSQGKMPVNIGVIIGKNIESHDLQEQFYNMIKGKKLTNATIEIMAQDVSASPKKKEVITDLFGTTEKEMADYESRARFVSGVRGVMSKAKNLLGKAAKGKDFLEEFGNRIDQEKSAGASQEAAVAMAVFDKLRNTSKEVKEIIDEGMDRVANGEKASTVQNDTAKKIIAIAEDVFKGKPTKQVKDEKVEKGTKEGVLEGVRSGRNEKEGGQEGAELRAEETEEVVEATTPAFSEQEEPIKERSKKPDTGTKKPSKEQGVESKERWDKDVESTAKALEGVDREELKLSERVVKELDDKETDAIQEQEAGEVPVRQQARVSETVEEGVSKPRPEKVAEQGKKEVAKAERYQESVKKVSKGRQNLDEASKNLSDALSNWAKTRRDLGVIFDPKSKAEADVALLKAFVEYARAYGAKTAEDISELFKRLTGGDAELDEDGADLILDKVLNPVGRPSKKVEDPVTGEQIGVTNAYTESVRKALGKDPISKLARTTNRAIWDEAVSIATQNPWMPADIVRRIASGELGLISPVNQAMILIDRIRISNERDALVKQLEVEDLENNPKSSASIYKRLAELELEADMNDLANTNFGTEWGRTGAFRQALASRDYTLEGVIARAKSLNGGRDIKPRQEADIRRKVSEMESLEEERAKLEAEFEQRLKEERKNIEAELMAKFKEEARKRSADAEKRAKAKSLANSIRKKKVKSDLLFSTPIPPSVINLGLEAVASAIEAGAEVSIAISRGLDSIKESDWYKKLTKDETERFGKFFSDFVLSEQGISLEQSLREAVSANGISQELRSLFDKIIYDKVVEGVDDFNEIVDYTYDLLSDVAPNLDKQQLADAMSGYGATKKQNPDQIAKKVRELKALGRLAASLRDVEQGQMPKRSGLQRDPKSNKVRQLEAEIRRRIKELNLEEELTQEEVEERWRSERDAKIRRLENSIEDVQKEIDERKRIPRNRRKVWDDPEINRLESELNTLREARDSLLNDEMERAQVRATNALKTAIDNLEAQINELFSGAIPDEVTVSGTGADMIFSKPAKRLPKAVSAEIDALRERKRKLQQDYSDLLPQSIKEKAIIAKALKNRERVLAKLEEKLKNRDFQPKTKSQVTSNEIDEVNRKIDKKRYEINVELEKIALANRDFWTKFADLAIDIFTLPKGLVTSFDLSAPFNQGIVFITKPRAFGAAFAKMLEFAFSPKSYERYIDELRYDPKFGEFVNTYKLFIADQESATLKAREELFISRLLAKIKKIPVYGTLYAASERSYVGFINKLRWDIFSSYYDSVKDLGLPKEQEVKELRALASHLNTATGRGRMDFKLGGKRVDFAGLSPILNAVFFSPRMISSRFAILNPVMWYRGVTKTGETPIARRQAVIDYSKFLFTIGISYYLFSLLIDDDDEDVGFESDPRSSDFMKVRIGNRRYDALAGYAQGMVLLSRIISGSVKSTSTGEIMEVGDKFEGGYAQDYLLNFFTNKLTPSASLVYNKTMLDNKVFGRSFVYESLFGELPGEDIVLTEEMVKMVLPLFADDLVRELSDGGYSGPITSLAAIFGMRISEYGGDAAIKPGTALFRKLRERDVFIPRQREKIKVSDKTPDGVKIADGIKITEEGYLYKDDVKKINYLAMTHLETILNGYIEGNVGGFPIMNRMPEGISKDMLQEVVNRSWRKALSFAKDEHLYGERFSFKDYASFIKTLTKITEIEPINDTEL